MIVKGKTYQNDEINQKDRNDDIGRKDKSHIQCWKCEKFEHYADKCLVDSNKDNKSSGGSSQSSSRGNRDGSSRGGGRQKEQARVAYGGWRSGTWKSYGL